MADFDPDAYLAAKSPQGSFDPDTYLAQKSGSSDVDPIAAIKGFGNGAAAGYLPQLEGLVGGLIPDPDADVDAKMRAQGFTINQPADTYINRRDAAAADLANTATQSPGSYYGGMVGGALATAPIANAGLEAAGIGSAASDANTLSKVGQAVKGGAALGAIQNPGDATGQIDPVQADQRLKNAASGAAIGGVLSLAGSALNSTVQNINGIPDFINDFAETRAAKASGATKADFKNSLKFDPTGESGTTIRQLGRYAIDNKLVQPGDSIQDVADRSSDLKDIIGQRLGAVYDRATSMIADPDVFNNLSPEDQQILSKSDFNPIQMSQDFMDNITNKYTGKADGQKVISRAAEIAKDLAQNGSTSDINGVHDFRMGVDDLIYKSDQAFKRSGTNTAGDEALGEMRDFVSKKITSRVNALDSVFKGTLGDDLKSANKAYSNVSKINSMANNGVATQLGNQMFSPSDKGAGMLGAGIGAAEGYNKGGLMGGLKGAAVGGMAGLLNKGARTYLPGIATGAANTLSNMASPLSSGTPGAVMNGVANVFQSGAGLLSNPAVAGRAAAVINQPDYSTIPGRNSR